MSCASSISWGQPSATSTPLWTTIFLTITHLNLAATAKCNRNPAASADKVSFECLGSFSFFPSPLTSHLPRGIVRRIRIPTEARLQPRMDLSRTFESTVVQGRHNGYLAVRGLVCKRALISDRSRLCHTWYGTL